MVFSVGLFADLTTHHHEQLFFTHQLPYLDPVAQIPI